MKIVICGSMSHYLKMVELKNQLISLGHEVILPALGTDERLKEIAENKYTDTYQLKIKYDYIRKHYNHIVQSDCVLIANYDKNGFPTMWAETPFWRWGLPIR